VIARLLALVVLLLAGSADSVGYGRGGGFTCPKGYAGGGLVPCSKRAYFEFAPPDGVGMDGVCACGPVTGAREEAIAFTRTSSGVCMKSSTSYAAVGDMVVCASGKPRSMPGGNGTGGPGLLVESSRTNVVPRSQEIDDVSFGDFTANGAAAPVLNGADAALAPDGTLTAEDYTFDATAATQASARAIGVLTAAAYSAQVWIRGTSGSGAMDVCIQTAAAPTATCSTCSFDSIAWTQCKIENVTSIAAGQLFIGNMTYLNGGTTRTSNRVYVWGADAEAGKYITSYIPTSGVATARSAETAKVNGSLFPSQYSKAATIVVPWSTSTGPALPSILMGEYALKGSDLFLPSMAIRVQNGTGSGYVSKTSGAVTVVAGTPTRIAAYSGYGVMSIFVDGSLFYGPASLAVAVGGSSATTGIADNTVGVSHLDGVIKNICWDANLDRCR